ncbi:hypothetical protein M0811_05195 [Anaeramoeba ignava]|uniref:BTB domain-containing protein n=1 Tax=Anaeramoeba ignava TaxID=1746090 RepID=A0A9Q0LSV9_ANAIG|nr:hypothetical protein M0811_05195 [Anaeramoeba ignava]
METYSNLEKLSNDLKNLFQNQNQNEKEEESYFDFEIFCEQNQTSFKTHKSILSSRSQYFKSLFKSQMREYQENKMILKDFSSSILFPILNYFYSGKIAINLENAIQILFFSSKYLVDELIEICLNFIKKNFKFETVVDILKLSESMNFNQLLDSSYQFIFENFEEFIKTPFFLGLEGNHLNTILTNDFIPINEFELFQLIIKWGKHKLNIKQNKKNQKLEQKEKEQLQNQISTVIDKIRFIDFSKKELKDVLKENLIPNKISEKLNQFQTLQNDRKGLNQFIEKETSLIFQPRIKFKFSSIIKEKEYVQKLKEWIHDDKFFSKMKKGFSAKRDGFDLKLDLKGNSLPVPDRNAFLFSLRNDKNNRKPEKFPIKKGEEQFAAHCDFNSSPCFGKGPSDLYLNSNLQTGFLNLGNSYSLPNGIKYDTDESKSYLAGSFSQWRIEELETFFI